MYKHVFVVIPTYNEAENIGALIHELCNLYEGINILVVDDGKDDTATIVSDISKNKPNVHILKREVKSGRGTAVLEGIKKGLLTPATRIVEMDADFSHNPRELATLLEVAHDDNVVIGSRYLRESRIVNWPLTRRVFSACANVYASLMLRIGINDYTNGYRVYGRNAAQKIDTTQILSRGYIVLSEIAYQLYVQGVAFQEVPTIFVNRKRGTSQFSFGEIKEALLSVLRIRKQYKKKTN